MKKIQLLLIGLLLVPTLFFTSCDQGAALSVEQEEQLLSPKFDLMADYMIQNNLDINKIITNVDGVKFVKAAPALADLPAFINTYHIVDIRNAADFANGHIEGAINAPLSNLLTEGANATKPVLVVCYTGQTACYGTALMRMYGFEDAVALKWGMSGWNANTLSWNSNIGNIADGHANWSYGATPANLGFDAPIIESNSLDGNEILKERIELVISQGLKAVTGAAVINAPTDYFINNYFGDADYTGFGHIDGAYRILPLTIADNSIKNLDPAPDAKVVTYCYTGQTSAVVTACLRVLGYDAYTMTFGMNGVFNSNDAWVSNQWVIGSTPADLPVVN